MTDIYIPDPDIRIGKKKFWYRRTVRAYQARLGGLPAPAPQPDDLDLVGSLELRLALGGISEMTLWRRSRRTASSVRTAPEGTAA